MKTLYVTDLDGTLLNRNDKISDYCKKVINSLIDKGILFSYATARSLSSASIVTNGLTTNLPVIVYNGAFIKNASTGENICTNLFHGNGSQYINKLLTEYKLYPLVYAYVDGQEKVSWIYSKENYGIRRYLNMRKGDKRLRPVSDIKELYLGDIFYYTCIGEKEELITIYEELKNNPEYNCTLQQELYRPEYWCEIMPKGATKANAIKQLKSILQCEKIISFGDAINDIPMFSISDECYAVENAVDELKNMATGIIGRNEDNGVAVWLEKHCKY